MRLIFLLSLAALASACSSGGTLVVEPDSAPGDTYRARLAESADRITNAWTRPDHN